MNYVWSSNQQTGSSWPSAYTEQSMMVAVNSGESEAGSWQPERRNLKKDFQQFFGESIQTIDVVAIMSDTDQ